MKVWKDESIIKRKRRNIMDLEIRIRIPSVEIKGDIEEVELIVDGYLERIKADVMKRISESRIIENQNDCKH